MLIGDLSRRTGVAARLLRYYEEQGLLCPERDSNGYRVYEVDAPYVVARIRGMLAAGLSTDAIRELLPCTTGDGLGIDYCPEVMQTIGEHLDQLDTDIADLQRQRATLASIRDATRSGGATQQTAAR